MTGSHRYKYLFFHVYKVAGCSLVSALSSSAEFRAQNPHLEPRELLADPEGKKMFDKYYTFAFVRNPWDWQVSLYEYMRGTPDHPEHELCISKSFDEYIEWRVSDHKFRDGTNLQSQYSFLSDDGTEQSPISLDFVGRLERIGEDFAKLRLRLGIGGELPHVNKSKRKKDYRDYYSTKSRDQIAAAARIDIDTFNYEF
tara:strand:- start:153 stop:746 length:594 start_codon:yes stop_codon:yes gene_type:complete